MPVSSSSLSFHSSPWRRFLRVNVFPSTKYPSFSSLFESRSLSFVSDNKEEDKFSPPYTPEEVTSSWLTSQLRRQGQLAPEASVKELEWNRLGEGVGLLSILYRLRIHYNGDPGRFAPQSLVAKFGHMEPEVRRLAQANGSYEREVGFYDWLGTRPGGKVDDQKMTLRTPLIYFCNFHSPSGQMVVMMEDLGKLPHLDQVHGSSLPQAVTLMRDIARHHAQHWGSPELDHLPWLPKMNENRFKAFDPGEYPRSWPLFLRLFGDVLPSPIQASLEHLPQHCPALLDLLGSSPRTLLHGDLRLDNVYQLHESVQGEQTVNGSPASQWNTAVEASQGLQLLYMDYGDCGAGRGLADVAYFLSQSLEPEMRRAHEKPLLRVYYETLTGPGQVTGYSWEECWEDYRRAVLYYWVLAVNVAAHVPEGRTGSRVFRLSQAITHRSLAAITDLQCLEILRTL